MPVKVARSASRRSFGLPELLVAIHTSRQSCCKAGKARIFTPIWESSGKSRINMRAVQLTAFGNPVEGLEYVDIPEPNAPGPNEVLIGVEFSPINPNDLMVAQGIYAFRPPLPAVIGNEGVGRVLAIGPGVETVKVGDRVLAPPGSFTWRERMVVSAGGLSALPSLLQSSAPLAGA